MSLGVAYLRQGSLTALLHGLGKVGVLAGCIRGTYGTEWVAAADSGSPKQLIHEIMLFSGRRRCAD
jgi:hypothetical protein